MPADEDGVPWGAGARDGVLAHDVAITDQAEAVTEVYDVLRQRVARPWSRQAWRRLHEVLCTHTALSMIDQLLRRLESSPLPVGALRRTGRRLATTNTHPEPIKFGIALVGVAGGAADRELLHRLGRNEEFTLFSAVALMKVARDWESELLALARDVEGWGRVHVVERLTGSTRADVRRWILVSGFRTEIGNDYLARTAAVTGDLAAALAADPDDEVLEAARDILTALFDGATLDYVPPGGTIRGYADGARVTRLFMPYLPRLVTRPEHLVLPHLIERFAAEADGFEDRGWSPGLRAEVAATCRRVLSDPRWPPLVRDALASDDFDAFSAGVRVTGLVGVDVVAELTPRLVATPADSDLWWGLLSRATDDDVDRIVALARELLPLTETGGEEGGEDGGEDDGVHEAVSEVVDGLRDLADRGSARAQHALDEIER